MTWVDAMRREGVLDVATTLGFDVAPPRSTCGGVIYRCPACGAERERRGERHVYAGGKGIGLRRDGGWACFACGVSGGDAIDFVAVALGRKRYRELSQTERDEVNEWCRRFVGVPRSDARPTRAAPAPPAAKYPSLEDVAKVWRSCLAADIDDAVSAYFKSRGLDPAAIADRDLARVLPRAELPGWARKWNPDAGAFQSWHETGHIVILPLFDERGMMRSVLARTIDPSAECKSLAPSGYARSGLILADAFGRFLLQLGAAPEWWPREPKLRIVVAEGEIDLLTASLQWSDAAEHAPATFGVTSGSWTEAIASRVPSGATVVIATDHDAAGDRYAAAVVDSLRDSAVALERWRAA